MFYAKKRRIKHIWHVHEIIVHPKKISYIFPKLLNKYADVVVCNSKATMDNLVLRQKQLANKTQVIHNGLSPLSDDYVKISKEDLGFENAEIYYTGFWSQGDGLCFDADINLQKLVQTINEKRVFMLIDFGLIETSSKLIQTQRLEMIIKKIEELINKYKQIIEEEA